MSKVYKCDRCGVIMESSELVKLKLETRRVFFNRVDKMHFCEGCCDEVLCMI